MHRVSEILDEKGRDLFRIRAGASVLEAVQQMVEHNVGALLVTDGGKVVGIVTERDYLRRAAGEPVATDAETPVREITSTPLVVATPATPVEECMAIMTDRRIRHFRSSTTTTSPPWSRSATWSGSSRSYRALRDQVPDRLHHRRHRRLTPARPRAARARNRVEPAFRGVDVTRSGLISLSCDRRRLAAASSRATLCGDVRFFELLGHYTASSSRARAVHSA